MGTPRLAALLDIVRTGAPADLVASLPQDVSPSSMLDEQGTSLVLHAVFSRRADMLDALLAHSSAFSLHDAAAAGALARVEDLLGAGTEALNLLSPDGWTALHLAAHLGHLEVCERLIEAGASTEIFSRAFERNLPLHAACAGGHAAVVELLARHTANVDTPVAGGFSALMEAAYQGLPECVSALLVAGADPARKRDDGKSALDIAREGGHNDVVAVLERGS